MTFDIRPTPPDHPQVLALIAELDAYLSSIYPPDQNYLLDLAGLQHPSVTFLAAWHGDTVVGCGAVRTMPAEAATGRKPYGEIKRMFVSPAQRGARALMETGEELVHAVRMYRANGYAERGPYGEYPDNGTSLFLEKRWTTA
jgi:putative acetyltransferase